MALSCPHLLPADPVVGSEFLARLKDHYDNFKHSTLPERLEDFLADEFRFDLSSEYGGDKAKGNPIRNPWGKASGQLSMTANQVREDVDAGLGFVVLKTVIAEDSTGDQSMDAWAVREARMVTEQIQSRRGESGWTVSWKGRGWWQSFDDYLALVHDAVSIGQNKTLIVPSCKYHLPTHAGEPWRDSEYEYSTTKILNAWMSANDNLRRVMPIEKDFSPTLAGSDLAAHQAAILNWMAEVPDRIRNAVGDFASELSVGMKIFNARFSDDFQLEMLDVLHRNSNKAPDFFVYGNRLFDPTREFEGHRGIAVGGPDLSDRNLAVMTRFQATQRDSCLPWSATGNISSGKLAIEYALRGATSFQMHTLFQLPAEEYSKRTGSRTERVLHDLYLHPVRGFIVWLEHLRQLQPHLPTHEVVHWIQVCRHGK